MVNLPNLTVIGLTGMSGAGKTTVSDIFGENGFDVINCDKLSREVVDPDSPCLKEISRKFDEDVLTYDNGLDRKKMSAIIFTNPQKRILLNEIIYPYISYIVIERIKQLNKYGKRFVIIDAPTLFESGIDDICDIIISVVTDKDESIKRIMARDNLTYKQAENRLSSQHDISFYKNNSTYCLENNASKEELTLKTSLLINKIRSENGKN